MTINIGICDDCREQIRLIERQLKKMDNVNINSVLSSDSPDVFLDKLEYFEPDILFLDIEIGNVSGIDIAEKVKLKYPHLIIIFITGHEKYAIQAFQLRAFHYLLKPITEVKFKMVVKDAVDVLEKQRNSSISKLFVIRKRGEVLSLKYGEILYFEKTGRKIKVHLKDHFIEYNGNFNELLNEIDNGFFIRCHQGYIANISKIIGFKEKRLLMNDCMDLPVSRSYMEKVRLTLANKLFNDKALI